MTYSSPFRQPTTRGSDSVLWLAAAGAILLVTMSIENQWITWAISGAILVIVLSDRVIRPALRKWRMRRPFSAYFRSPIQSKTNVKPRETTVPADSKVHVQINRDIRITHHEFVLVLGFEGDEGKRPRILSLENTFIERGKAKYGSPEDNENQVITDKGRYQIKGEEFRVRGSTATVGCIVETFAPGRYEMYLGTITDAGGGRPKSPLTLVVEDRKT